MGRRARAFDGFQRRHAWLGFPLAVRQKYADDQASSLAASITYYAFFSIFPLLLVFVSALGYLLRGHASLERSIVHSALGQFPIVGQQLRTGSLRGSGIGLALGVIGSLWAGLGVCQAAANAMDRLWGVPMLRRPGFVQARVRALALLLTLGVGVIVASGFGGLTGFGANLGVAWKLAAIAISTLVDFAIFWIAFRMLTTSAQTWRDLRGGAAAAAIAYELLQLIGGYYVGHVVRGASNTYGTFALVIGLLSWIYLAVHVTLLCAEGNVVATRRLWPRSLTPALGLAPTHADERALRERALVERRRVDETIEVRFGSGEETHPAATPPAPE